MKCGFSKVCITPPVGVAIAGGYKPKYSVGVLDDLFIRCVAFEDGDSRAAILSLDVCYVSEELQNECRATIARECGFDRDSVIITCTHTHQAPLLGACSWNSDYDMTDYTEHFKNKLTEAATLAFLNLAPSKFFTARGVAENISFIRRYRMKDGSVITNPGAGNPDIECPLGEPNDEVRLLKICREGEKDIYLVNFGTHACTVGGPRISGDFPGVVCRTLEGAIGDINCMMLISPQGDSNHININPSPEEQRLRDEDLACDSQTLNRARVVGYAIAGEVLKICMRAKEICSDGIKTVIKKIAVPANKDDSNYDEALKIVELCKAGRGAELPYSNMELNTVLANANRIVRMKTAPDFFTYTLYAIKIGDFVFSGLPGEPFVEIGKRIVSASPYENIMVCCLTNSKITYFPTSDALRDGGYEAVSSSIGIGTDDIIVSGMTDIFEELKGGGCG